MNHIDDKEAIELLRKAGCTALEIERLCSTASRVR